MNELFALFEAITSFLGGSLFVYGFEIRIIFIAMGLLGLLVLAKSAKKGKKKTGEEELLGSG